MRREANQLTRKQHKPVLSGNRPASFRSNIQSSWINPMVFDSPSRPQAESRVIGHSAGLAAQIATIWPVTGEITPNASESILELGNGNRPAHEKARRSHPAGEGDHEP